ncbi:MAG: polysaccharide biosynthesis/export family protein [Pseudomonadales bacterium]|nr:polysaccharide biosynthesis/export family protein [Pseudomonadales bacterium]
MTFFIEKIITKKVIARWLGVFIFASGVYGCGTLPKESDYSIPLQHFGKQSKSIDGSLLDYTLRADDVLDVLYRFNTISDDIYTVSPHDKLNVMFLTASEYDNVHQVRPDGYLSLPFVGDVKVAGLSVQEITEKITKLYRPVLKDPSFFVSLTEYQVHLKEIRASLDHPNMGQARLVTVRQDQKVSLPLIGDLSVKGKTIASLREEANTLYANVSKGLSVDVLLQKSHPRRIYVFGEVNNPGGHLITGPISLFQAVAIAGGANHDAELETVVALRQEEGEMVAKVFNLEDALNGNGKVFSAMLNPEDVIYIPRTRLSTTAQVMRHVSEIFMFRGLGATLSYRVDDPSRFEDDVSN